MRKGFSYNFSQAKKFKKKKMLYDKKIEKVNPSPKKASSWCSNLFGLWVFSVLKQNLKFSTENTYDVDKLLEASYSEVMFEKCWIKELLRSLDKMASPKLMRAIWCRFGAGFSILTVYLVLIEILSIGQVYLLYMLVKKQNTIYLLYLIINYLLYIFLKFHWNMSDKNIGIQLRVGIQGLLLKKILLVDTNKISAEKLTEKALSSFENLFELEDLIKNVPYLIVFIFYILILTTFLCFTNREHLPAILITSLVLVVIIPIKGLFYYRIKAEEICRKRASAAMVEVVEEFFKNLCQIKVYCMESKFIMELKNLREKKKYLDEVILSFILLNFVTLMSFLYFSTHGEIWILPRNKNVLPAIAGFQILILPISINSSKALMNLIRFYKMVLSLQELLMMMDRCEQSHCANRRKQTETSLKICGVSLKTNNANLININLGINASKLICFSKLDTLTKENLLRLLLKEVDPYEGTVEVYGEISFCSRTPWLFPRATVKKNIICTSPFNAQRFQKVLNICELNTDYVRKLIKNEILIGECGDENIKKELAVQISIARVLFNDSDIIIFDRPLEFVSYKKSEKILNQLVDYVRRCRKTIIMFSDTDLVLSKADKIFNIVMGSLEENKRDEQKSENSIENFESDELFSSKMMTFNKNEIHNLIFRAFRFNNGSRKTYLQKYKLHFTLFWVVFSGVLVDVLNSLWIMSGLIQNTFINWDNDGLIGIILPTIMFSIIYCCSAKYVLNEFLNKLFLKLISSMSDLSFVKKNKRNAIIGLLGIDLEKSFYSNLILFSHFLTFTVLSTLMIIVFTPLLGFTLLLTFISLLYFLKCSTPFMLELFRLNDELKEIVRQHYRVKESQVLSLRSLAASEIYMNEMTKYFNRFTSTRHLIGNVEETITFWVCFISCLNIVGITVIAQITGTRVYDSVSLFFSLILPSLLSFLIKYIYKFSYTISKMDRFLSHTDQTRVNKDYENIHSGRNYYSNEIFSITPGNDISYFHFYNPGDIIAVIGVESPNPIYNFLGLNRHSERLIGSKCNLIPSEPHIFRGSLKNTLNLSEINDSDLWMALSKTGMSQEMMRFPLGLSTESKSWDEIFTVYQRQLLFLSVQIVLQNRIVVIKTDPKNISLSEELDIYEKTKLYLKTSKVFLFTNRIDVAMKCDKVIIFKNGFFNELRTLDELLKHGFLFNCIK